jgi:hypothetical protein
VTLQAPHFFFFLLLALPHHHITPHQEEKVEASSRPRQPFRAVLVVSAFCSLSFPARLHFHHTTSMTCLLILLSPCPFLHRLFFLFFVSVLHIIAHVVRLGASMCWRYYFVQTTLFLCSRSGHGWTILIPSQFFRPSHKRLPQSRSRS